MGFKIEIIKKALIECKNSNFNAAVDLALNY
jgi:hypothetical protein